MTGPTVRLVAGRRRSVWLDLARAGNFPSVWSNVLAAFVLSDSAARHAPSWKFWLVATTAGTPAHRPWFFGPEPWKSWLVATAAGTLIYAGGATWNDVCDSAFDARHRPERPIASGLVSRRNAAWIGGAEMAAGIALFLVAGASPGWVAALGATILLYDAVHKRWAGAIALMAGCRVLLAAVIATLPGHHAPALFCAWAAALFLYIVALSAVARLEYRASAGAPRLGRIVGSLLACIPLIDAAALAVDGAWGAAAACAAAAPLGRWAQRRAAAN